MSNENCNCLSCGPPRPIVAYQPAALTVLQQGDAAHLSLPVSVGRHVSRHGETTTIRLTIGESAYYLLREDADALSMRLRAAAALW